MLSSGSFPTSTSASAFGCRRELSCFSASLLSVRVISPGVARLPGVAGTSEFVQLLCQGAGLHCVYCFLGCFLNFFKIRERLPHPPLAFTPHLRPWKNPMGGGASQTAVHGVTKSQTTVEQLTFSTHFPPQLTVIQTREVFENFVKILYRKRIKALNLTNQT